MARDDPPMAVFVTCILSHLPMLLTIVLMHRRRLIYECVLGVFSVVVSFLYHSCECFDTILFLSQLRWHRLDNIGAIHSVVITCIHLCLFENSMVVEYMKYSTLCIIIILQEGHPWDERYTAAPVLAALLLTVGSHITNHRRRRGLLLKRLIIGGMLSLVAVVFFCLGLDDRDDPFRVFHGLFHIFIGLGVFTVWTSLKVSPGRSVYTPSQIPDDPDAVAVLIDV